MSEQVTYNAWEPVIAKEKFSYVWKLEYCGIGFWKIYRLFGTRFERGTWKEEKYGDVNALANWARTKKRGWWRNRTIPKLLGIRVSGSYESKLEKLRATLITIGFSERYFTEGGIGTSFNAKSELTAYAELGSHGGIDVWVRQTRKFSDLNEVLFYKADCKSMKEIEEALREAGMYPNCARNERLIELIDSIVHTSEVTSLQTYIAKPKGRGRNGLSLLCSFTYEVSEDWTTLYDEKDIICDALKFAEEHEISIDWYELLGRQKDLCPSIWSSWAEEPCCYEDFMCLVIRFPGTKIVDETVIHSMCTSGSYDYFVYNSHHDWLISCFKFVGSQLEALMRRHGCEY